MISLICGENGTGKTKKIIEFANNALKTSKGQIVFIDIRGNSFSNLNREIRFINVKEFSVKGREKFLGFIKGLVAENYDIDKIYVDNLLDITNSTIYDLELIFQDLKEIEDKYQVHFVFSINCNREYLRDFIEENIVSII
ncbi:ATP-binding protein [Garciella nitratireducens]|uniref:Zona occludens toxin N-terminal domain-containing protein n=1 Tax=Garciella nitratireducens DSM 15102 TaxID=1121911 RepID=A0A1T4KJN8_9FIRM|nr:ATP-binding protein [Garciella nitratireducens]SJZ42608.1 hypothetical protein SAMN02745973_00567 [Garciella nitratireducens DSM 15102]